MDILRKELNAIYDSQHLSDEILDNCEIQRYKHIIESLASVSDALYVITDALADHCYIYIPVALRGYWVSLLSLSTARNKIQATRM